MHNVKILKDLYQLDNDFRKGLYLYNSIKNSLPGLARFIHNHKDEKRIKAIIGVTMLHQGSERLGFEIHSIQNKAYLRFKQIAQFPIYFLSTVNQHRKNKPIPKYLFMPKQDLIEKYYPMPFPETDHFKRSEAPPMR
ncbi:hypothetical protein JOD43_000520 [Pullulanibacillus pueri]|nr:hypothetical protein [Pullulanibacillus pueri]